MKRTNKRRPWQRRVVAKARGIRSEDMIRGQMHAAARPEMPDFTGVSVDFAGGSGVEFGRADAALEAPVVSPNHNPLDESETMADLSVPPHWAPVTLFATGDDE